MTTTLAWLRAVLLAGLGTLLCAYPNSLSAQTDPVPLAVSDREGYAEGCDLGIKNAWRDRVSAAESPKEDKPARYESDSDFRSSWDAGYKSCYERTRYPDRPLPDAEAQ